MTNEPIHIAIDGPVASGKGSVARELSTRLGIPCLDTGAMYRGVGIYVRDHGFENFDKIKMDARIVDNVTRIYLDGVDVTDQLRENEVSRLAYTVATIPAVREYCVKQQQKIAESTSLVAEGRDICSVVLPSAKHKFYLTADVKVRAKRRYDELQSKGQNVTLKEVIAQTKARDKSDLTKGGLKKTKDAIVINATNMTVDQVVAHMLDYILR